VSPELATGEVEPVPAPGAAARKHRVRRPRSIRGATSVLAQSTPLVWLTGGGLVISLAMVVGLLVLVLSQGVATFWPGPLVRLELDDGRHCRSRRSPGCPGGCRRPRRIDSPRAAR
jgi:hypothetical protein